MNTQLITTETRIQSQAPPSGRCGGETGSEHILYRVLRFALAHHQPTRARFSSLRRANALGPILAAFSRDLVSPSSHYWYSCHFTAVVFAILLLYPVIGTPVILLQLYLRYCYCILSLVLLSFCFNCICDIVTVSCHWYFCHVTVTAFAILLLYPVIGTPVTSLSLHLRYCYCILSLL
jgi:hypothetical protein